MNLIELNFPNRLFARRARRIVHRHGGSKHILLAGALLAVSITPTPTMAQTAHPIDHRQSVPALRYESVLKDYRAFEPDQEVESWTAANDKVDQIGGWRTYLKRATKPHADDPSPMPARPAFRRVPAPQATISQGKAAPKPTATAVVSKNARADPQGATGPTAVQSRKVRSAPCRTSVNGRWIAIAKASNELSTTGRRTLDDLVPCLLAKSYVVGGHTDNSGSASENLRLSQQRARAVIDYLVSRGVPARNLRAKGYGASKPIDSNATARGRARNRRVDLRLVR